MVELPEEKVYNFLKFDTGKVVLWLFLYVSIIPYLWSDFGQFTGIPLLIICYPISCLVLFIYDKRQHAYNKRIEFFKPTKEKAACFFLLVIILHTL